MQKAQYKHTEAYIKSVELVKKFVDDVLHGDISKLQTLCFDDITKAEYIGDIQDPDMFRITQAVYIILWGDCFCLDHSNLGEWKKGDFRGDTMNSFGSLIGKENRDKGREFAYRAKFFGADRDEVLWNKILRFKRLYHSVGNFLVLPNRGSIKYGINGARGKFFDEDDCKGMRDYFDWFLIALADYQKQRMNGVTAFEKFAGQLHRNPEYDPGFMRIEEWEERFFLTPYFKNGEPALLFKTPLKDRLKKTAAPENRKSSIDYYSDEEYLELLRDYLDKSIDVIQYRGNKIVGALQTALNE